MDSTLVSHYRDAPPAALPGFVLLVSAGTLGTALLSQYWGGLHPCELCIWQRWPYVATILLGLVATLLPRARRALMLLAGLVFLVGACIAGFHVGVEQTWWEGTSACGNTLTATTLEDLRAQIFAAPVVRCTDIAWSFAGISMAGFNMIASIVFAGVTLRWLQRSA